MQCTSITSFDECITPSKWDYPNITRPFSILYYILGGSAFYTYEGVERRFKKDHLYILPANRIFSLRELPYDKLYSVYIHAYTFPEINEVIEIDVNADGFLLDTLTMIRKYAKGDISNSTYVQRLTDMLLAYVIQTTDKTDTPLHGKIKKHIEKNFVTVFKENDLSSAFNYSNSHLSRIFKSEYNMTPKQYAEQLILKEITVLLHEELSICDISRRLAFSSPENMCRFFKGAYGCSPSEYIKKFKNFPL